MNPFRAGGRRVLPVILAASCPFLLSASACAPDASVDSGREQGAGGGQGGASGTGDVGGAGPSGAAGSATPSGGASIEGGDGVPSIDATMSEVGPGADAEAMSDVGVRDTGWSDSSVVLGGPSLPCTFAFCEGFEGDADGAHPREARWVGTQGTNQVVVDSTKPARGSRALHIKFEQNPQQTHWMRTNEPFPKLARRHYGRVFVWINQLPDAKIEYRHWVPVEMHPQGGGPVLRALVGVTP